MATPPIPALFLSHSGEQKGFTWSLYRELLHVHHNPFFDQDTQDSLRKGDPFPSRIVEACRACKLGVVVVSHEYIESLWPMLELQQFLFHNPSSPNNVYPVFYKLKPADLSKQENLRRWKSSWERQAPSWHAKVRDLHMAASASGNFILPMLEISSWPKALEMLRYQSGEILPDNKDEHAFIQTIVSNICKRLPPPDSFLMGDHFKGAPQIQQKIHELFQQQQMDEEIDDSRRMPIAVGVYGVGGSGKTTVCKYMLSFYNKDYPGRCCFLQFPSREEDENQLLVQSIKDILSSRNNLAKQTLDMIKSVEQAMPHLQEMLKRYRVFLVLDNVWDWAFQIAKQIMTMDYMSGSRLLVTARSESLLQTLSSSIRIHVNEAVGRLLTIQIVHVPSISEEEAVEALMGHSSMSSQYVTNAEDLQGLARSCFFGEQCHPLLLKAVGVKLRHLSGFTRSAQQWTQLISRLQVQCMRDDEDIEDTVLNVLKTSFDALQSKLQNTFLNLGTCIPKERRVFLLGSSQWLSLLSHNGSYTIEDIRDQLVELEYHGLIQVYKRNIVIHDLQRMLIENIVRQNNGVPRCFFFEGGLTTLSERDWKKLRYIHGFLEEGTVFTVLSPQRRWLERLFYQRATSPNMQDVEVLFLYQVNGSSMRHAIQGLSMKHMQSLCHLRLSDVRSLKELSGWHGAPNLVSIELQSCTELQKIESIACLRKLERLVISRCRSITNLNTTIRSSCENLKSLVIRRSDDLKHLAFMGHLSKLQGLYISDCPNLVDVGMISAFTSLQRCTLQSIGVLKFPYFNSINLRVLYLTFCTSLQSMEGRVCGLTGLEELDFWGCYNLESIPDLKLLLKLRRVKLSKCHALREVKLGDAGLTSLEELSLQYNWCRFSTILSCSPLPIRAFTNLRVLNASGEELGRDKISIDSHQLPIGLEVLDFQDFETLIEITGLSALVNLRKLSISWCACLRQIGHWEPPFISNLCSVHIDCCPILETLSTMRHLTSLTNFHIHDCPMLQMETLPRGLEHFGDDQY